MQDGLFLRVILRDGRFKEVLVLLIPINGDSGVSCLFFYFCESCNESLVHFWMIPVGPGGSRNTCPSTSSGEWLIRVFGFGQSRRLLLAATRHNLCASLAVDCWISLRDSGRSGRFIVQARPLMDG